MVIEDFIFVVYFTLDCCYSKGEDFLLALYVLFVPTKSIKKLCAWTLS